MLNTISNISFGKIIQFDNKNVGKYNSYKTKHNKSDEFIRTIASPMAQRKEEISMYQGIKKEDIEIIQSSQALQCSPVGFLAELLPAYLTKQMNEDTFLEEVEHKTKEAQLYFSFMPQEEKANNAKLFKNEFNLSNEIIRTLKDNAKGETLRKRIEEAVKNYVSMQQENIQH